MTSSPETASAGVFHRDSERFADELDEAAQWHAAWTWRVLRCAALRADPGDDVMAADAHRRCPLAGWIARHREHLERLDPAAVGRLRRRHRQMHDCALGVCRCILAGRPAAPADLDRFERAQAGVVADLARLKTAHLERSASLDQLTGLPLRHGMDAEFERCRAQALRHDELMVVMMLDLDCFKDINDARGHATGDLALRHVAQLLRAQCRAGEPVFRYGGEEFVAFLQTVDRDAAQRVTERILQAMRDHSLALPDGARLRVRASAGVAVVDTGEPMRDAIARADRAMYAAKAAGRDTWRWAAERSPARPRA